MSDTKPSNEANVASETEKKKKKKKDKPCNRANLTVAESAERCISSRTMLLARFLKVILLMTLEQTSMYVCNDASLFVANDPPEYATVTGVEGKPLDAQVGGRCLVLPDCPIGIISGHLLESTFKVEYIPNDKLIVHVSDDMALQFKKVKNGTM